MWAALTVLAIATVSVMPGLWLAWIIWCVITGRDIDNGRKLRKGEEDE